MVKDILKIERSILQQHKSRVPTKIVTNSFSDINILQVTSLHLDSLLPES